MSTSVFELSKRLQKSLDSNYNVIDLVSVFEIIKILEGIPITKEQLETTRLAKYINQLRRKTTNEQLARRSKNLLKKWRNMLMPAIAGSSSSLTNGAASRSMPTTPSKFSHSSSNNNSSDMVITIPDEEEGNSSRSGQSGRRYDGSRAASSAAAAAGGGQPLKIPTELTNFYLQNKKIIDESSAPGAFQAPTTPKQQLNDNRNGGGGVAGIVPEEVPKKRRGRKKGSKGIDGLIGAQPLNNHLFSANSNSGLDSPGLLSQKKVKTTKQLIEDLQIRHLNLKSNLAFPDLSNDEPAHAGNNKLSPALPFLSSPMSSNHSDTFPAPSHAIHQQHHNHNSELVIRSAPVTPSAFQQTAMATQELDRRGRRKRRAELETVVEEPTTSKMKVEKTETVPPPSGLNFYNKIDEDIWQLKNKLPPINREEILHQIEIESSNSAEVACSCELVECESEEIEGSSTNVDEDETDLGSKSEQKALNQQRLKNKSIFDDDEMSPSIDKNNNSEEEGSVTNAPIHVTTASFNIKIGHQPPQEGDELEEQPPKKTCYKFVEDENCAVKKYNEKLDHLNRDYHLTALHQLYVPHINGNWNEFPDLKILTVKDRWEKKGVKRKRRISQKEEEEKSDDDEDQGAKSNTRNSCSDLMKGLERLQGEEVDDVESVVPSTNPFFYFCRSAFQEPKKNPLEIGRLVPLRVDYGPFIVPPKEPPPDPGAGGSPPKPPPIEINQEVAKNFGLDLKEGINSDIYDRIEMAKFLEATIKERVPKFQMANFFYKKPWPEFQHNNHHSSRFNAKQNSNVDVLNSLFLNRVVEFKRKVRRKRRRNSTNNGNEEDEDDDHVNEEDENDEEFVFENDVNQFLRFLKKKKSTTSLRRFLSLNDTQLLGVQRRDPDQMEMPLFNGKMAIVKLAPPLLKLDAYFDWPKLKWHFLLDFYRNFYDNKRLNKNNHNKYLIKAVPSHGMMMMERDWEEEEMYPDPEEVEDLDDEDEDFEEEKDDYCETVKIMHENNFRLPSFNQLTEENFLGIRQRVPGVGSSDQGSEERGGAKAKFIIESFQQREFVKNCLEQWPHLFENVVFNYDEGIVTVHNIEDTARWRLVSEFKDLLKEVCNENSDFQITNGIGDNSPSEQEESDDSKENLETHLFKEWHEAVQLKSYNDELLTILPYVVID